MMEDWIERQPRRRLEHLALDAILNDPGLLCQFTRCTKKRKIAVAAKPDTVQASRILNIPDDITRKIFSFLSVLDKATCSTLVCREWIRLKTLGVFTAVDFEGLINPGIVHMNAYITGLFKHLEIRFNKIRKLDLYDLQGHVVAMKMLLRQCTNLIELKLYGCKITDSVLYSIRSTKLESLIIVGALSNRRRLPYTGAAARSIISKCQKLSTLEIGRATLDAAFVAAIFNSEPFHNIRSITLSTSAYLIAKLIPTFPQLEELTVSCIYFCNLRCSRLPYTSRLRSIQIKSIMPHYGKESLHDLFRVLVDLLHSCRKNLTHLSIDGNFDFVRPGHVSRFINAMKIMPALSSFKLESKISIRKLEALRTPQAQFPNLKELILRDAAGTPRYNRVLSCLTKPKDDQIN